MPIIDLHVHPPVPECLDGCGGPHLESAEPHLRMAATARPVEEFAFPTVRSRKEKKGSPALEAAMTTPEARAMRG